MSETIDGQEIVNLRAIGSCYHNESIIAFGDDDKAYRIKISEFLKIINGVKFKKVKKKVHTYLEIDEDDYNDRVSFSDEG